MSYVGAEQTPFQALRLVANGGVIVDGVLRIVTTGPLSADLAAPADAVLVANFSRADRGFLRGSLTLMPPLVPQADGWHDWRPPILDVWIHRSFPDVAELRSYDGSPMSFGANLEGGRLLSLHQRFPAHSSEPYPTIFANVATAKGVLTPSAAGMHLQLTGPIDPTKADDRLPALTDARLECDVMLPWTYLQAVGSPLAFVRSLAASYSETPWQPSGVGAQRLALGGSLAFFDGTLDLPGQRTDVDPDKPYLLARMDADETMLHAAKDLALKNDGFVWPARSNDGPELVLGFGTALFARMLDRQRSATLVLSGPGIGHVNGQTGRIYETGGPCTQQITSCQIDLDRSDDGLRIVLSGELAPLEPGHWASSLGPRFTASCQVPTDFMLLRQWPIQNLVSDWRGRHGIRFD